MFKNNSIKFKWVRIMANKEKINNFLKHKRLIIISLVAIGFIVLVFLVYLLTYVNNKPKPFASDSNVKITNKCEYFDFTVVADEIDLDGSNNSSKPTMSVKGQFTNVKEKLTNVTCTFEVHTNWTTKTDTTASDASVSGTLTPSTTSEYYTDKATISLLEKYPFRVMPLVKVNKPTLYVKITYTRQKPETITGETGTVTETVYYKLGYSNYYKDGITILK